MTTGGGVPVQPFLAGGGEMGQRIRDMDCIDHPLGPPESWPQSLRSALSICLHSDFPTAIYWGPDLRLLYNDAWAPIPAERHPGALGRPAREVWPEIWDVIGPQFERVMSSGEGFSAFDQMLPMMRGGEIRETYWNYSFTPIRGEDGALVGIFNQGHETTQRVMAERRNVADRERLRRMFDQAPGFMALLRGPEHRFELTNIAYRALVGGRDVVGRTIREALPELDGQGFFQLLDRVFETGEQFVGKAMQVTLDQESGQRWVDFIYHPIRDETGTVSGIFVQGQDVTPEREAQSQLRERQEQLAAFIAQSTAGFAQVDLTGLFTLVNERFCEIAGRSREELLTLKMQDITHPLDLPANVPLFDRAVRDGTPYTHEKRYVRPDGDIVWVSNSVSVVRRAGGEPYGILAVSIDVTDRRRAEDGVRENEVRLRAVTDNLPGGMVFQLLWGPDADERRFIYVSQSFEKLTGYPAEKVAEDPLLPYRLVVAEDVPAMTAAENIAIETLTPFDMEARFRRADGQIRWGRIISAPRPQDDGTVIWDGIQIDVTDHKRLEMDMLRLNESLEERVQERTAELERVHEQLRQSQKLEAMGQLTGGVAHDFNNLLTPIIGSLDLLARKEAATERERRLTGAALESAERAKTLVQRLLAFARRQPLQAGPVDLGDVVSGMTDLVASTSGPRVQLVTDIEPGLPPAMADRNQIEMAVLNLCVNARDAMPDGGTLSIRARSEEIGPEHPSGLAPGTYLNLSVSDTGTGMSEDIAAKAIEPFFSTKGIGRGTGLGLSMVHGLALQLGGALTVRSQLGLGTTIALRLPRACAMAAAEGTAAKAGASAAAGAGRILLVDDEEPVRISTAEMLIDLGYEVEEADGAAAALAALARRRPDIVVTDHLMPGMTGTDLALKIRSLYPEVRTMIVSGYADIDDISPDLPRLAKPFRQSELADSLAALVAR